MHSCEPLPDAGASMMGGRSLLSVGLLSLIGLSPTCSMSHAGRDTRCLQNPNSEPPYILGKCVVKHTLHQTTRSRDLVCQK